MIRPGGSGLCFFFFILISNAVLHLKLLSDLFPHFFPFLFLNFFSRSFCVLSCSFLSNFFNLLCSSPFFLCSYRISLFVFRKATSSNSSFSRISFSVLVLFSFSFFSSLSNRSTILLQFFGDLASLKVSAIIKP